MSTSTALPVAAIVMTRDESTNIDACLESLAGLQEVFVVDSGSTDDTRARAAAHGATVVDFRWNGRYPKKKQWCLDNLPFATRWVLFVDADERATPQLLAEIADVLATTTKAGFFVRYQYYFGDTLMRHGHKVHKLILLDRHRTRFPELDDLDVDDPMEIELHFQPIVDGATGMLRHEMIHRDHDSLYHYFDRHNRYTEWEAVVDASQFTESQPGLRRVVKRLFAVLPFRGAIAFVDSFVLKRGFLDGRTGLDYALARGFYYWQAGVKRRERRSRPRG